MPSQRSFSHAPQLFVFTTLAIFVSSSAIFADEKVQHQEWEAVYDREILPIVQELCIDCHHGDDPEGNFDISHFTSGKKVSEQLDRWKEVGKRMRLKEMPPEGSPQLNDQQKSAIHRWLDSSPQQNLCLTLATDETQAWYRGYVMSRRLTRTEYFNAIRDLIGIPVDVELDIPSDGSGGEGFDTTGDSLFTSAIHVQRYLLAASWLIDEAVPDSAPTGDDARALCVREARDRLLGQMPSEKQSETDAARSIVERFARRAWRRPVSQQEVDRLLTLFESASRRGMNFIAAVREPLKAILVSANFLFVIEPEAAEGGIQKLTQHQLATRLALFIWSSIPDDELLRHADEGKLETEAQVLSQTRRMLADPKALALSENFGMQWLGLTSFLSSVQPDSEVYPAYDEQLASDMYQEAVQCVAGVIGKNRSVLELIDSSHVYVNGNLAAHYGLDLPKDASWQQLETDDRRYGGVTTLGAVLVTTSFPRRTSPVLRGRWLLEEVLGGEVPPPPPSVPALDEAETADAITLRQRLEAHRKNPDCAACHNRMDPLGFGLENFDGLGRWRDNDKGLPIDSSGKLPAGDRFQGPAELKQVLLRRADEFEEHLIKKLLGFALGRELNKFDQCVIEDCKKQLASNDHRSFAIIESIVTSYPFQHRYFKSASSP